MSALTLLGPSPVDVPETFVPRQLAPGDGPGTAETVPPAPLTGAGELTALALSDPRIQQDLRRLLLEHRCGLEEVLTKISNLQQEFSVLHEHDPVEHVDSRLKTAESIVEKVRRRGGEVQVADIRRLVTDIAGIRITCSFTSDVRAVAAMLVRQPDLDVVAVKDYIAAPKPNGYRSLHLLVAVPVFLSDSVVEVQVEIQLRTVAMDAWASLEHKIRYKYHQDVPADVQDRLTELAAITRHMDSEMEELRDRVHGRLGEAKPSP